MIHTDLHSVHGEATGVPPSNVDFPKIPPCVPAEPIIEKLTAEMEALLLESVILDQPGAIKTASEKAVSKRRKEAERRQAEHSDGDSHRVPRTLTARRSNPRRPDLSTFSSTSSLLDDRQTRARSQSL